MIKNKAAALTAMMGVVLAAGTAAWTADKADSETREPALREEPARSGLRGRRVRPRRAGDWGGGRYAGSRRGGRGRFGRRGGGFGATMRARMTGRMAGRGRGELRERVVRMALRDPETLDSVVRLIDSGEKLRGLLRELRDAPADRKAAVRERAEAALKEASRARAELGRSLRSGLRHCAAGRQEEAEIDSIIE